MLLFAKGRAMQSSQDDLVLGARPSRTRAGTDVEQRRRVIVALLHQHPHGLTAREIREATGWSKNLTESALSGLFVRSVVSKRGHCYVLAVPEETLERP
jgi:hypothetical protein